MALLERHILYTVDEYLQMERASEERHEYIDGHIVMMSGESLAHDQICINLAGEIRTQLRGTPCQALSPNMKVRTRLHEKHRGRFSYPDLTVVCGSPVFHDQQKDVLVNPVVIFEVLSPSTEWYDRSEKYARYRDELESLTDYVLVAQGYPHIEHYTRRHDGWLFGMARGLENRLDITNINCTLRLADVYERVEFPELEEAAEDDE